MIFSPSPDEMRGGSSDISPQSGKGEKKKGFFPPLFFAAISSSGKWRCVCNKQANVRGGWDGGKRGPSPSLLEPKQTIEVLFPLPSPPPLSFLLCLFVCAVTTPRFHTISSLAVSNIFIEKKGTDDRNGTLPTRQRCMHTVHRIF